jgi:hypothetical protein
VAWNNYEEMAKFAREHPRKSKLANNTYLIRHEDGSFGIKLHQTEVVVFEPSGKIILNSDGWDTPTTRQRIFWYSPFTIWSRCNITYIELGDELYHFTDGMFYEKGKFYLANYLPASPADLAKDESNYRKERYRIRYVTCSCCKQCRYKHNKMIIIRRRLHCPTCVREGYVIEENGKLDCARCRHRKVDVLFE